MATTEKTYGIEHFFYKTDGYSYFNPVFRGGTVNIVFF